MKQLATVVRVAGNTDCKKLASMIHREYLENNNAKIALMIIGASAAIQALKGVAIAKGYCSQNGIDLIVKPGFTTVVIDEKEMTAMRLQVEAI